MRYSQYLAYEASRGIFEVGAGQALLYMLLKDSSGESSPVSCAQTVQWWPNEIRRNEDKRQVGLILGYHKRIEMYSLRVNDVALVYGGAHGVRNLDSRAQGS